MGASGVRGEELDWVSTSPSMFSRLVILPPMATSMLLPLRAVGPGETHGMFQHIETFWSMELLVNVLVLY